MPEKLLLLDGNSLINRAFFAVPVLTNSSGEHTNAVYGFFNIFFRFLDEEKPDYIGVAFDLHAPTFRHTLFTEYKGTRKGMPDELRSQVPMLKNVLSLMNIKIYEKEGFEADDILGTLAKKAEEQGISAVIISGDRDMLQCATDTIKIRIPKTKSGKTDVYDYFAKDVIEQLGVTPKEFIDVKALMGDSSDNIPGVPGVGEKTAYKIIQEYKTLENALDNAAEIKPKKASENLVAFREQAILSQTLARIDIDAPVEFTSEESKTEKIYTEKAYKEITRLGFKSHLQRFKTDFQKISKHKDKEEINGEIIQSLSGIEQIVSLLLEEKIVAYMFIVHDRCLLGVSFCAENIKNIFVTPSNNFDEAELFKALRPFFESNVEKVTLDAKQSIVMAQKYDITIQNIIFDVMLGGYILNASNDKYEYNDVAIDFLGENYNSAELFFGKGKDKKIYSIIELQTFAINHADVIWRIFPIMTEKIKKNGQEKLYNEIELPLIYVLADMEILGISIDKHGLMDYGKALDEKITFLQQAIHSLANEEFNINSPKQLGIILFEKLGLKCGKKTKTGWSTAADILDNIAKEHEIIPKILEYRMLTKLKSTYVEGLLAVMDKTTGKIHSTFNQAVTATGRISSTEPNLQNIPIRTELGRQLRKVFIPSDSDFIFIDADYSQIELRVLADMSGDETFISAFNNNEDIHCLTASQVFKIPLEEVTPEQRRNAKAVNFGIVYGISAYSLSQEIGVSVKEAERYIEGYFEKYPKVKQYLDETIRCAKSDGYASTIFNRRRAIPELSAGNFATRAFGERVAMNMPIQGTAADIIKIAMIKVCNRLKSEKLRSRLILQVHDELLVEAYRPELDIVMEIVQYEMENAIKLRTVLEVDLHCGENWFEAK